MTNPRDELVSARRRLPDLALTSASGAEYRLRARGRRSPVLVLVHAGPCAGCDAYVQRLAAAAAALGDWDGDVLVISPGSAEEPLPASPFPFLHDPGNRVAAALGVRPPAVVIADQWGEVQDVREAGDEHRFPSEEEIESWLRYLAIQCPECQGEAL
jgi:peroxiredoxin